MKHSRDLPRNDNFSFAEHVGTFDTHIRRSIPRYAELIDKCAGLSRRFIQEGTLVVDYGCSTGAFPSAVQSTNEGLGSEVSYIGIDLEPAFERNWAELALDNLRFEVRDMRLTKFQNVSLATSFLQFSFFQHIRSARF